MSTTVVTAGADAGSLARRYAIAGTLLLAALLFALPFLTPEHRYPLTTFDSEWIAASILALSMLTAAVANGSSLSTRWPLPTIAVILVTVGSIQYALGMLNYSYSLSALFLYMCATLGAYVLGRWLVASGLRIRAAHWIGVALLVAGLISVAVQLLQLFDVRSLPTWLVVPIVEKMSSRRPFGNIAQPNHLATYLVWGTIAALYFMRSGGPRRLLLAACAVLFGGLALTGSRMGSLFAVLVVALVMTPNPLTSGLLRERALTAGVLVLGYGAGLLLTRIFLVDDAGAMATAIGRYAEGSFGQRSSMWFDALRITMQHPWLGVGIGEYGGAQYLYAQAHPQLLATNNPHNLILHLTAELGLPAALLVLGIVAAWCWHHLRTAKSDKVAALLLALIGFVLAHSLLEYPLWHLHFLVAVAVLVGLTEPATQSPRTQIRSRFVLGPIGIAALCAAAIMKADFESIAVVWDDYLRERAARVPYSLQTSGAVMAAVGSTWFRPQMERAYIELLPVRAQMGDANIEMSWRVLTRLADEPLIVRHVLLLVQARRFDEARLHIDRLKVFAGADYARFRDAILDAIATNDDVVDPIRRHLLSQ